MSSQNDKKVKEIPMDPDQELREMFFDGIMMRLCRLKNLNAEV